MDLGIRGRWAVLLGSSRGLGRACADSVAREGVNVVVNGRTAADVERLGGRPAWTAALPARPSGLHSTASQ